MLEASCFKHYESHRNSPYADLSIPCDICGKTVKSRQSLSIYRGRYHTRDGENMINHAVENKFVSDENE